MQQKVSVLAKAGDSIADGSLCCYKLLGRKILSLADSLTWKAAFWKWPWPALETCTCCSASTELLGRDLLSSISIIWFCRQRYSQALNAVKSSQTHRLCCLSAHELTVLEFYGTLAFDFKVIYTPNLHMTHMSTWKFTGYFLNVFQCLHFILPNEPYENLLVNPNRVGCFDLCSARLLCDHMGRTIQVKNNSG